MFIKHSYFKNHSLDATTFIKHQQHNLETSCKVRVKELKEVEVTILSNNYKSGVLLSKKKKIQFSKNIVVCWTFSVKSCYKLV